MTSRDDLTVPEKLLLAAYFLEENGKRPFSAEDLVVAGWQRFPNAFGLAGHIDSEGNLKYPDSNRVFAEIMGSKPIRKRGFLVKVDVKMYQLTEAGREHAKLLITRVDKSFPQKIQLSREIKNELKRLFSSKAYEKYKADRTGEINFYDACAFWGISPRSSKIQFEGRISNFIGIIEAAKKDAQGKTLTFSHKGESFGTSDLDILLEVHKEMLHRFCQELDIIQERDDERK